MGARSTYPVTGGGDWTCRKEDHWLFANTGMKNGDSVKGIIGWEWHGDPSTFPGLKSSLRDNEKQRGRRRDLYLNHLPGPKGYWVFNAATIWWSDGLSAPPGYIHRRHTGLNPPDQINASSRSRTTVKKFLGK